MVCNVTNVSSINYATRVNVHKNYLTLYSNLDTVRARARLCGDDVEVGT